jgi:hypothetical protein
VRVVGPLFRSRDTNVRESELMVFLQPEIVDYDQVMRSREYMALETINCRLDGIPRAEGCPPADGVPCGDPIAFPPIESEFNQLPPEPGMTNGVEQTSNVAPLRPDFDNRYRTTGDAAPLRQGIGEKQAQKPSIWKRMWGQ